MYMRKSAARRSSLGAFACVIIIISRLNSAEVVYTTTGDDFCKKKFASRLSVGDSIDASTSFRFLRALCAAHFCVSVDDTFHTQRRSTLISWRLPAIISDFCAKQNRNKAVTILFCSCVATLNILWPYKLLRSIFLLRRI